MVDQDNQKLWKKWESNLSHEETKHKKFRRLAKDALKVFENDTGPLNNKSNCQQMPILRNVVEVQTGLITSKQPQAKLAKRMDQDNTQICMKLEKAANYFIEIGQMQSEACEAFEDYLTAGLGLMRIRYDDDGTEVVTEQVQAFDSFGNPVMGVQQVTKVINQRMWAERVNFDDFGWEPCTKWRDCGWVRFSRNYTLAQFKEQFEVYPNKYKESDETNKESDIVVHEIWDKETRTRLFWSDMHEEILDSDEDPLGIEGFFPCDEPMFFGTLHDKYEPRPEYSFWQEMDEKAQELMKREGALIKGTKDIEFYDKSIFSELSELENAQDGKKIPVDLSKFTVEGRTVPINDLVTPKDHTSRVGIADKLEAKLETWLQKIFQTTGIADIMQAMSDPRETARAQGFKNAWGNARLARKRYTFDNHVRGTIEVMINALPKLFTAENLSKAAGVSFTDQEYQYLTQTDEYRVDVETLSTLSVDKDRDQQNAMDLTTAVSGLFTNGANIPGPLMQSVLKNMIKAFPDSREFEETVNQLPQYLDAVSQLQQQIEQMNQQIADLSNQNMAMAGELNRTNQAKMQKEMAEADKKVAEAEGQRIENAQKAAEALVPPNAMVDEMGVIRQ